MRLMVLFLFLTASGQISLAADLNTFFKQSDSFFKEHVVEGKVDYQHISVNNTDIQRLYTDVQNMDLKSASKDEKKVTKKQIAVK